MEKIWLSHYQKGVPADIPSDFSEQFPSIMDLLKQPFIDFKDRPAYVNFDKILTYQKLNELSDELAAFFQQQLQLKKGERLALMLPNLLQYPVALLAAFKVGVVIVNVNPMYTPRELEYQLKDSGATAILILENMTDVLNQVLPNTDIKHVITTRIGDLLNPLKGSIINFVVKYIKPKYHRASISNSITFTQALKQGKDKLKQFVPAKLKASDIAFLQYTGGTTGISKGAILTHRNMVANVLQGRACCKTP